MDTGSQDQESFLLLKEGAEAELVEKRSRFIATVRPAASEEEALAFIEEMKKRYHDARHNCSAFVIGDKAQLTRSSDDGEPGGTAGKPMLDVLLGSGIRNVAAVVTRYFGGTLLGTGGLVRAYSGVLKDALEKCGTVRQRSGVRFKLRADYEVVGKIQYILADRNVLVEDSVYAADVEMTAISPVGEYDRLCRELVEATSARVELFEIERAFYASAE